jgi:tetratricopeptide (TPR) repeat protein
MNNGVRAFRETNYSAAAEYFTQALEFDPEVPNGRLYLGLSYFQQYVPGMQSPENARVADQAIEVLEGILEGEPMNATAIAALASIYQNQLDLERAHDYYILQTQATPDDAVAFYSVGSVNWWILSTPSVAEGLTDEDKMAYIEEAQEYLDRALELNPLHENAAVMKNLQYRQEALLIPDDTEDEELLARRDELIAMADEWFDRALEIREENAVRETQGLGAE